MSDVKAQAVEDGLKAEREAARLRAQLDLWARGNAEALALTLAEAAASTEADPRWVAIAKTHFEQGFMALRRGIFNNHGRPL